MAETKSKSRPKKAKDATRVEANDVVNEEASKSMLASKKKETKMAESELPSVIEFDEDISEAEAPVPLPVGDYPAEVRAAVQKAAQQTGNPYASVQFFINSEAYPADYTEGEPDGMLLTFNRVSLQNTPAGRHRLRKFVEAIGAPGGTKIDLNDWIGRTATVTISHDTYEGEVRANVAKVTPA
jgi:hypothetical protein